MCKGPEDPSQRSTESTVQCYSGKGLHRYNQGGACAGVVFNTGFQWWADLISRSLCLKASRWEEVGGLVQAAGLGCEDHTALVQAAPQPGEAQHPGPLLRKHVRQIQYFCFDTKTSVTACNSVRSLKRRSTPGSAIIAALGISALLLQHILSAKGLWKAVWRGLLLLLIGFGVITVVKFRIGLTTWHKLHFHIV